MKYDKPKLNSPPENSDAVESKRCSSSNYYLFLESRLEGKLDVKAW